MQHRSREDSPSRTAAAVAFRRAAHQVLDQPPVFRDPVAKLLLSQEAQSRLDTDPWLDNRGVAQDRLRAFLAARSRLAEDRVAEAAATGVRQYVVLGAGLDTFAYRNPFPELRVFEVDHPRTQAWKLERVRAAGLTALAGTVYVPVDFETQTVARELVEHGFDASGPTALSWLGVVPYLEEATVWATFEWVVRVVGDNGHIVPTTAASQAGGGLASVPPFECSPRGSPRPASPFERYCRLATCVSVSHRSGFRASRTSAHAS
jgi:methyltransferase (TIGR00027 family)